MSRRSPGSPTKCSATRLPCPASTCRSTQLYAALSLPSLNHVANGASDQSRVRVKAVCQESSSRAWRAQNASASAAASSYRSFVATADAANCGLGGNVCSVTTALLDLGSCLRSCGPVVAAPRGLKTPYDERPQPLGGWAGALRRAVVPVRRAGPAHRQRCVTPLAMCKSAGRLDVDGAAAAPAPAGRSPRFARTTRSGPRTSARGEGAAPGGEGKRQWCTAFSAPAPVRDRTSISANLSRLVASLLVTVPSQPSRKASGIEMMPGLSSGNQWKSIEVSVIIDRLFPVFASTLPDTTGENAISTIADVSPP